MLYRGRDKKEFYLASLLYDAIEYRHLNSVKSLLVEKAADPNIVLPKKGISAFHLVIGCDSLDFAVEVTSLILQNGGNPNTRSDDGLTPVHIAAAWGRAKLLSLLLSNGGDPEARDANYKTPFHYASEEGFADCIELLKLYLPVKNEILKNDDKNEGGRLVLDKILINNGYVVEEYDVIDSKPLNSIISSQDHLQSLPKTDKTEYVLNWFSNHQNNLNDNRSTGSIINYGNCHSSTCSESSPRESDNENDAKRIDAKFITFRKIYRKTRKLSDSKNLEQPQRITETSVYVDAKNDTKQTFNETTYTDAKDFTRLQDYSKESGIMTLPNSIQDIVELQKNHSKESLNIQEKSSDYVTCSHNSINSLEKNIFEITEDLSNLNIAENVSIFEKTNSVKSEGIMTSDNEMSFVSVSEVYKYVDKDEGVVLYERRLLKAPSEYAKSIKSSVISSKQSSVPETIDSETLRKELTLYGYNPGPITVTTKRVYLKKLHQLKKYPVTNNPTQNDPVRVYSIELEKTLRDPHWCADVTAYKSLEENIIQQFSNPDPTRKWREGVNKSSFTYLLLDPRITRNLPYRNDNLSPKEIWETFLSSIFYVGKGKRSRPYQHLYEAVDLWKINQFNSNSKKLQKIIDIWKCGSGVICLHIFLNIIPVEAYTREAAMISAIKLENLTNIKSGEYYGIAATWNQKQKKMLGVYLLYKAMSIFLNEGERQLCPSDIG